MAGFLYFIPEHVTHLAQLEEWGLAYVFGKDSRGFFPCQGKGVDGVQGTVIGDERYTPATRITYKPELQTWRKMARPGAGTREPGLGTREPGSDCFVGLYNEAPPGPAELIRRDALEGHAVRLSDGNEWIIPVARGAAEENGELRYFAKVPRKLDLTENGAWGLGGIIPRYAELWNVACAFWNAFIAARPEKNAEGAALQMEFSDVMHGAVMALATNYRVRADEAALLGLFDEQNCWSVCRALIDWPTIEAFLQKKTQEELPAGSGT